MVNKKVNRKSIFLLGVILLVIISMAGVSYAYFMINAQDDDTIVGLAATTDLTLDVSKVTPTSNNGDMVPQLEDSLDEAVSNNYNCVDDNNNVVCHIYKIVVKNTGDANINVKGTIIFENPSNLNLKYKLMDNPTTLSSTYVSHYGYEDMETPIVNNVSLTANQTNTYYMVVWIDETENAQNSNGTYRATVKFENIGSPGATSTYVNYLVNSSTDNFRSDTYKDNIKNVSFVDYIDTTNAVESWDMGTLQDGGIIAWLEDNEEETYYDLYIGSNDVIYGKHMYDFFNGMAYVDSISFDNLDTRYVTNMASMFYYTGKNSESFTLNLGDKFDTSNVTNMSGMFSNCGYNSTVFTLDLGNKFNTSNVTNMYMMFTEMAKYSLVLTLDLGSKFDTSNVTNMYRMFSSLGYSSESFQLDLGNKFDTSNVSNMDTMFSFLGYNSMVFTLDLGDKFDTSNVNNMSNMFNNCGYSSTVFTLDLGDKFDTSNVNNMGSMFNDCGYNSTVFTLDLGNKFNTSNVTQMNFMFSNTGYANDNLELNLTSFTFDNVTSTSDMFGSSSKPFKTTQKIYVKDADDQNWLLSKGFTNLSTSNVLVAG